MTAALLDWLARRFPGEPVEVAETHISVVAFVDDRAYKLKKAVTFPFVDLSTPQRRHADCEREVALNRRVAPDVYLGVVPLTDDAGRVVDHVVEMRRMPAARRLSTLVRAGADVGGCVEALAGLLARFHGEAATGGAIDEAASHAAVTRLWDAAVAQTREFEGPVLDPAVARCVGDLAARYLRGRRPLFDARVAAGRARDGHGDLLAQDIFCLDDGPRVLDCLEFDDELRYGDVLGDVAFLAMDLESLARPDLARSFLDRYRAATGDGWPASLEHLYIAYRAHVRAKIACLRHAQRDPEAADHATARLALAHRHLETGRIRLVLVGGPPATGKTTLASALSAETGWPVLRSDVVRKELAGVEPGRRIDAALDAGPFTPERKRAVYDSLLARAGERLVMGESVILDASWSEPGWRSLAREVAGECGGDLVALRCEAPAALAAQRADERARRAGDASDADARVAVALAARFAPWPDAEHIDTSGPADLALAAALAQVNAERCGGR